VLKNGVYCNKATQSVLKLAPETATATDSTPAAGGQKLFWAITAKGGKIPA
jgi:hypothetical protein